MRFLVKHLSRTGAEAYITTVDADDLREASLLAKRYNRKGYTFTLTQQLYKGD